MWPKLVRWDSLLPENTLMMTRQVSNCTVSIWGRERQRSCLREGIWRDTKNPNIVEMTWEEPGVALKRDAQSCAPPREAWARGIGARDILVNCQWDNGLRVANAILAEYLVYARLSRTSSHVFLQHQDAVLLAISRQRRLTIASHHTPQQAAGSDCDRLTSNVLETLMTSWVCFYLTAFLLADLICAQCPCYVVSMRRGLKTVRISAMTRALRRYKFAPILSRAKASMIHEGRLFMQQQ